MEFKSKEFKEFEDYVMKYFRPSTEMVIETTRDSPIDGWLDKWYSEYGKECISIGPYINLSIYGKFETDKLTKEGESVVEYLFMYKQIDNTKLTGEQLTLGRTDFIDI